METRRDHESRIRDLIGAGCTDAVLTHVVDRLRAESDDPVTHAEQMLEHKWLDMLDEAVLAAETDAVLTIVDQMSAADRAAFTREGWREGIAAMLVDEWEGLDLDAVLAGIEDVLAAEQ